MTLHFTSSLLQIFPNNRLPNQIVCFVKTMMSMNQRSSFLVFLTGMGCGGMDMISPLEESCSNYGYGKNPVRERFLLKWALRYMNSEIVKLQCRYWISSR